MLLQGLNKFSVSGGGGSSIKSIQSGESSMSGLTNLDITISEVNLINSIVIIYERSSTTAAAQSLKVKGKLTNYTTLNLTRSSSATSSAYVSWQVIEFNNVKSLQKGDYVLTTTSAETVTIASVNVTKSILIFSFSSTSTTTSSGGACLCSGYLSNSTTITFQKGVVDANIHWQVIEFS
jgi:hypothetical protein